MYAPRISLQNAKMMSGRGDIGVEMLLCCRNRAGANFNASGNNMETALATSLEINLLQ